MVATSGEKLNAFEPVLARASALNGDMSAALNVNRHVKAGEWGALKSSIIRPYGIDCRGSLCNFKLWVLQWRNICTLACPFMK
jgi:hypothetical protein